MKTVLVKEEFLATLQPAGAIYFSMDEGDVERIMAHEGLSPRDATHKAMQEITSAVIGMTLALTAVFIPMAFASGSVGVIY